MGDSPQSVAPPTHDGGYAAMQTEPPKADPPKRNRRWFQFSLRDLLALVALAALACAIAFPMIRKRQRNRAIKKKADEALKALIKPVQSVPRCMARSSTDRANLLIRG
jgi:hypothetical protein